MSGCIVRLARAGSHRGRPKTHPNVDPERRPQVPAGCARPGRVGDRLPVATPDSRALTHARSSGNSRASTGTISHTMRPSASVGRSDRSERHDLPRVRKCGAAWDSVPLFRHSPGTKLNVHSRLGGPERAGAGRGGPGRAGAGRSGPGGPDPRGRRPLSDRGASAVGSASAIASWRARAHVELAVGASQVHLDRLDGHEQGLGDLLVRHLLGGEPGDASPAGGERLGAGPEPLARTGSRRLGVLQPGG
jgi:hypothetical protein